jgi:hypothetical protein
MGIVSKPVASALASETGNQRPGDATPAEVNLFRLERRGASTKSHIVFRLLPTHLDYIHISPWHTCRLSCLLCDFRFF